MQLTVSPLPTVSLRTGDFFSNLDTWLDEPLIAFDSWLNSTKYRDSSKTVIKAMFKKFILWLGSAGLSLRSCEHRHVMLFIDTQVAVKSSKDEDRKEKKHQRYRYVRLIERIYDHLTRLGYRGINPGRQTAKQGVVGKNKNTKFLDHGERDALIRRVKSRIEESSQEEWIEIRDRALVSIVFGGGLKVAEVRRLTVNCIDAGEGWVTVNAATGIFSRRTRLLPFARSAVDAWLKRRAAMKLDGDLVFNASSGSILGRRVKTSHTAMHAASIFRRTHAFMCAAGVLVDGETSRMCAQTLRNTYAAMLMDAGENDESIAQYLGLAKLLSAQRMRNAYLATQGQRNSNDFETSEEIT